VVDRVDPLREEIPSAVSRVRELIDNDVLPNQRDVDIVARAAVAYFDLGARGDLTPPPAIREEIVRIIGKHRECDDCWYSCPKSEDGCCDDDAGTDCNCGVDRQIEELTALLARVLPSTTPPESETR
jgi:hypothetical protein